jgi:predicted Zn-dependent protease
MAMIFKKMRENEGFLAGKLDKKILPKNFRVYDDPTCDKWNGITLVGNYSVDDEGVEPQKIEIVKNGKLVNLPMSRTPTKKVKKSNGHGRGEEIVVSRISNLFIESKETVEDIEKELINLCKEEDLEYGIIISKLYKEEFLPIEEVEATIMSFLFGKKDEEKSLISDPIYAYKIYKDGRKELIGRIKLEEFGVSKLKDIVAVGSESYVYNSFVIVDLFGVKMKGVPISVIAPSIIIKEVDVTSKEGKGEELPLILHPYFEKK